MRERNAVRARELRDGTASRAIVFPPPRTKISRNAQPLQRKKHSEARRDSHAHVADTHTRILHTSRHAERSHCSRPPADRRYIGAVAIAHRAARRDGAPRGTSNAFARYDVRPAPQMLPCTAAARACCRHMPKQDDASRCRSLYASRRSSNQQDKCHVHRPRQPRLTSRAFCSGECRAAPLPSRYAAGCAAAPQR